MGLEAVEPAHRLSFPDFEMVAFNKTLQRMLRRSGEARGVAIQIDSQADIRIAREGIVRASGLA